MHPQTRVANDFVDLQLEINAGNDCTFNIPSPSGLHVTFL